MYNTIYKTKKKTSLGNEPRYICILYYLITFYVTKYQLKNEIKPKIFTKLAIIVKDLPR